MWVQVERKLRVRGYSYTAIQKIRAWYLKGYA